MQPKRTPLFATHVAAGARIVPFAGWEMPVQYEGVIAEHQAVRSAIGLFDISHMGILDFAGDAVPSFLDGILTNKVTDLAVNQIRYSLVCRPDGGVLDDVLIYRLPTHYRLVVNASNTDKIVDWLEHQNATQHWSVDITVRNSALALLAVQGPGAIALLQNMVGAAADLAAVRYYRGIQVPFLGNSITITRTGYTGEDGFELFVPAADAEPAWRTLLEKGASQGIKPVGLGARDTLRLEAGLPLYGHELDDATSPFDAGLQKFVRFRNRQFIGREALVEVRQLGPERELIGLELIDRGIAREGCLIVVDGDEVGLVTSGTFSPSLQKAIAIANVETGSALVGATVHVRIRADLREARVVAMPFYQRPR